MERGSFFVLFSLEVQVIVTDSFFVAGRNVLMRKC